MGSPFSHIRAGALAALLITCLGVALKFGAYLRFPEGKVIEPYGDGFKAYMSPAYHAQFDSSYSHFGGMHYPYGDHLVFSDPQPIIANVLKLIKTPDTDLIRTTINWTHGAMLLSIVLCALFLYLIFIRLTLPVWFSALAAAGMSFLAPMLERIGFHYGLAQPAAIPAVLYLLMLYQERPRWTLSAGIGVVVLFFSLFHFHYFGLFALGLSLYFFVDFLYTPRWRRLGGLAFHYALQVLVPFVLLYGWLKIGDPVDDRSAQPYGFLPYRAHWEGIFTSLDQPHFRLIHEQLVSFRALDLEARNYVGLTAALVFAVFVFQGFRWLFFRAIASGTAPKVLPDSPFLQRLFWAGLLLLIFSLGFPFTLPNMEGLAQYLGPLRQFRALGRFSWLFFFSMNIIAFAWLAQRYASKTWLLALALTVLGFEAFHFMRAKDLRLDEVPGLTEGQYLAQAVKIRPEDYQAILPIPFFHLGSDNFWMEPEGFIQQNAMVLAMQTGLPLTGAMMSRTSIGQTLRQLQLATEPYREPVILQDYPNQKPLLLLRDEERFAREAQKWDHFSGRNPQMRLLYAKDRLKVFAFPLAAFQYNLELQRQRVLEEMARRPLFSKDGVLASDSSASFVRLSWDTRNSAKPYQGKGGFSAPIREWNVVFDGTLPGQAPGREYLFSVWVFVNEDLRGPADFHVVEYDPQKQEKVQQSSGKVYQWASVFDPSGWALVEFPFRVSAPGTRFRIAFQHAGARGDIHLDELLLRPSGVDLYWKNESFFWKNNRFYPW